MMDRPRRKKKGHQLVDLKHCSVFLDANALDRKDQTSPFEEVDEFLKFAKTIPFTVIKPKGVHTENQHPNTPRQVRQDMSGIYTMPVNLNIEELHSHEEMRFLIKGNAKDGKHDADADHIFEAMKYGARFFVTNDSRLILFGDKISQAAPGLKIISTSNFVELCRTYMNAQTTSF